MIPSLRWQRLPALLLSVLITCNGAFCILPLQAEDKKETAPEKPKIDPALVQIVTVKKTAHLKTMVAAFVTDLIENDTAGLKDLYERKTDRSEELYGRRMRKNPVEAFEWFSLTETTSDAKTGKSSEESEYIYIARQQILFVIRQANSCHTNVLAKVRVKTSWKGKDSLPDGDEVLPGTTITMTFEGFLDELPASRLDQKDE